MADISKITALDGVTYNIKDSTAREEPIETKTLENIIGTDATSGRYCAFWYMSVRPSNYYEKWKLKIHLRATVPGSATNANLYDTESTMEVVGYTNTYDAYICKNFISSTSYRPVYYHSLFFMNKTGFDNQCNHYIGVNLYNSTNPVNTSYKRRIVIDLISYENCVVDFLDEPVMVDDIPNRAAHTGWYTSTNTSFTNIDACSNGVKMTGDANTTTISSLYRYNGSFIAANQTYRYQIMAHVNDDTLTPFTSANNNVNATKEMLTDTEFDPFLPFYYYNTTTAVAANAAIGAGAMYFHHASVDLRYSLNCGQTLTAHQALYLKVVPMANGKCKLATDVQYVQTLPSTADGYWYILLGRTYSTYQLCLYHNHPVYESAGVLVIPGLAITNAEIDAITG